MVYTDRENTPLKWNWFLKITLPISFVQTAYSLITTISSLFFLNSDGLSSSISGTGYSMSNMGIFFWPVIINVIYSIVMSIVLLYASIGLWRWESCGPKAVILNYILSVIDSIYLFILISSNPTFISLFFDTSSMSGYLSQSSMNSIYLGSVLLTGLFELTLLICNIIYYRKRKPLFDEYYVQPQSQTRYDAMSIIEDGPNANLNDMPTFSDKPSNEVSASNEESIVNTDQESSVNLNDTVESSEDPEIEESVSSEVVEQEASEETGEERSIDEEVKEVINSSTFKPYFCTQCGTKIIDENTNYCPNCGKKLK
jgi:rubrerythrin